MRRYLRAFSLSFSFRQSPESFFVEELPNFQPHPKGRYTIFKVRKLGLSTWEVADILERSFGARVGYAGLKDKNATAIQYFSLDSTKPQKFRHPKMEILATYKSARPLRLGDLRGNKFVIKIGGAVSSERVQNALEILAKEGVPNYFGYQRFGSDALRQAKALVEGEYFPKDRRWQRYLWSVWQSYLFNLWLAERVEMSEGVFRELPGDLYEKGIVTGLLPGRGMAKAGKAARSIERRYDMRLPVRGARRPALIYPRDCYAKQIQDGVEIGFTLPKASYATIVLENLLGRELDYKGTR